MARFEEIEDVSFLEDITLEGMKEQAVQEYEQAYQEITGKEEPVGDKFKAVLYAIIMIVYNIMLFIDQRAKKNLLKYATGAWLDNLALSRGLMRKTEEKAIVTIRFILSEAVSNTVVIPKGTRVTSAAAKIYFAVNDYTEIQPGETMAEVLCTSVSGGVEANQFSIGEINILVDPIAYISKVGSVDVPSGGADAETDDTFAQRIFDTRYEHSTTGAEEAYKYYVKSFSTLIDDVRVDNPSENEIVISILMRDRKQASDSFIHELTDYLTDPNIKAMSDHITVRNVERVNYSIAAKYFISTDNISRLTEIQAKIDKAVLEYQRWQSEKIGRDINMQKLTTLLIMAGAKRVEITGGQDVIKVDRDKIAHCTQTDVIYGGAEED